MSRVSVVVPTYNRTRFLPAAVGSVLAQTRPVSEIIIVNDGSDHRYRKDLEKVTSMNAIVRRIDNPSNRGVSYSRNQGIKACSGDYLLFLDDDDLLKEDFVEKSLEIFESHPGVDAVVSWTQAFPSESPGRDHQLMERLLKTRRKYYSGLSENSLSFFLVHCPMVHSFIFRREVLNRFQFPEDLQYGEDMYLWITMCKGGVRFKKLDAVCSYIRLHDENLVLAADYRVKSRFYEKLEKSGLITEPDEFHIHSMRMFYFKLLNGKALSFRLLWRVLHRPVDLIKFTWLHLKVRLISLF